jgi:PhnB protein
MAQINPYLSFEGNCIEVMNFYKDCLGGELTIQLVKDSPVADKMPPPAQEQVMHSSISVNGAVLLMASDMHRDKLNNGNTISLCINCDSEEQIRDFFTKFSVGGKIVDPLQQSFWGATFGVLIDKYDKQWMFNYYKA